MLYHYFPRLVSTVAWFQNGWRSKYGYLVAAFACSNFQDNQSAIIEWIFQTPIDTCTLDRKPSRRQISIVVNVICRFLFSYFLYCREWNVMCDFFVPFTYFNQIRFHMKMSISCLSHHLLYQLGDRFKLLINTEYHAPNNIWTQSRLISPQPHRRKSPNKTGVRDHRLLRQV